MSQPKPRLFPTTLGPTLVDEGDGWVLNLQGLPIFHGLSVLSRALSDMFESRRGQVEGDLDLERGLRRHENPELIDQLGVHRIQLVMDRSTIEAFAGREEQLQDDMRAILGTIQRHAYRKELFPDQEGQIPRRLCFEFAQTHSDDHRLRAFLENLPDPVQDDRRSLRVTIEEADCRPLDLQDTPHVVVDDLDDRRYIAGSTRIAHTWREGIRREAERARLVFHEKRDPHSHLFRQLDKAGLDHLQEVELSWAEELVPSILEREPAALDHVLKTVLLAFEDRKVRELLAAKQCLRIDSDEVPVYVELSQLSRVLHISLGERRQRHVIDDFLAAMPDLKARVAAADPQAFSDCRIVLVHHVTSEVLGLIAALRALGCHDLTVLFVSYAAATPRHYLDALLNLPPDEFRAYGLRQDPVPGRVEGRYRLAGQFMDGADREGLERLLSVGEPRYYEAMSRLGRALFLDQARRCRELGHRLLLLEDGGYVAPLVHRALADGATIAELLPEDESVDGQITVADLLGDRWLGSAEHTRNGHDRLEEVERDLGGLQAPALSIAISRLKCEDEAREVAASILNAVESVLHATGMVLSKRRAMVLGSHGAIGVHLSQQLQHRLLGGESALTRVDLIAEPSPEQGEARLVAELPRERRVAHDLLLGVTGTNVLEAVDFEEWLLHSVNDELWVASGSTKTAEFPSLARWLDALMQDRTVDGHPLEIQAEEFHDPQTGKHFGHRYTLCFVREGHEVKKRLYLLARLMPVNFLYYGVPTELIDAVLGQLLACGLRLADPKLGSALESRLLAVDRDFTLEPAPRTKP